MNAVLFDLYGTLIDIYLNEKNDNLWIKLSKYTKKYKKYTPNELKDKYFELVLKYNKEKEEINVFNVFQELFNIEGKKLTKVCLKFRELSIGFIKCYGGAKKLLLRLKSEGYKLYAVSNSFELFTLNELKKLDILDLFDGVAISSKYGIKKQNVEFYKKAVNEFNISDYNIIVVGNDYDEDIAPSKELGYKTVFIETNLTPITSNKKNVYGFDKEYIYSAIDKLKQ